MRGKWVLLSIVVILLGAAAGAVSMLFRGADPGPEVVERVPASTAEQPRELRLTGTVFALNVVGVPAPVQGTLEAVTVGIGEEVFEGQLLAHIQNTTLEAELRTAQEEISEDEERVRLLDSEYLALRLEASRAASDAGDAREAAAAAEQEYLRSANLLRQGATPRQVHEKIEAEHKAKQEYYQSHQAIATASESRATMKQKELELARKLLEDARAEIEFIAGDVAAADVVAPVSGVLSGVSAQQGEEVHPDAGDLFLIATDLSRLAVLIDPDPGVLAELRPGHPARVYIAELPGGWAEGAVSFKEDRVEVEFISPTPSVRPGLTAQVILDIG